MRYIFSLIIATMMASHVFATENKKNRKPTSEPSIQIINAKEANSTLLADIKMNCQVVLLKPNESTANLPKLQLKNLNVEKAQYYNDDGGKSITFWIKDDVVRNLNCLL